jgi:hypothetical protein
MKHTLLLLAALLLATLRGAEPPLVLILSGQSNMAGVWQAAELSPNGAHRPRTSHSSIGAARRRSPPASIGPEVTLAHALARAMPGRQIVLFKAAHGGTSQLAWQPELDQARIDRLKLSHDQRVGHAYAQLIAAWKKAFPDGGVKPAALLWMQGESDARVPELAKDYEQHLTRTSWPRSVVISAHRR